MQIPRPAWFAAYALALLACVLATGCASTSCPCADCLCANCFCADCLRIDPTGEGFFLSSDQVVPPAVIGGTAYPAPAPAVVATSTVPGTGIPTLGNLTAQPVYPTSSLNPFAPPTVVGPALSATTGTPVPVGPPTAVPSLGGGQPVPGRPVPREYVRLAPQRVMAPVGSEVVLKAGICSRNGYLLANQRIEWLLSRDGVGQFVDLNDRGVVDVFRWPWNTPRKVDNWYAIGATAVSTTCLRRGTPDPNDDLEILRGEAWVTVTSATEGTSYITAYSPTTEDWVTRRATALIYWIDAQWVFPASVAVPLGQSHTLTTVVTRRTDGAPLTGYIVRYEVVPGGQANLGYGEGSVTDVPTDARGQASVEVSPTDASGGIATINITVLRAPQAGLEAGPELALGRGTVTLNWVAGASATPPPALETPPALPPATTPPIAPPTTSPPPATTPGPFVPPADEPPPGQSQLDVQIRNLGSEQVQVGQFARFEIRVTNTGNAIARDVVLRDEFDQGLRVPDVASQAVDSRIRDLSPGDTEIQPISFEVLRDGQLCHRVTASDSSGARDFDRACVTGFTPAPVALPTLDVNVTGPIQQIVGRIAEFRVRVRNTGTVVAESVTLTNTFATQFNPVQATGGHEAQPGRQLVWQIDRLEVGASRDFTVQYECLADTRSACVQAQARTAGDRVFIDEHCTEILPALAPADVQPGGPDQLGTGTPPATGRTAPQTLQLSVVASQNPVNAGSRMFVRVDAVNVGPQPVEDVTLRVHFPREMVPDSTIPGLQVPFQLDAAANELRFGPIGVIRSQETLTFQIPVSVRTTGNVTVWARLEGPPLPTPIEQQSERIEIQPQP